MLYGHRWLVYSLILLLGGGLTQAAQLTATWTAPETNVDGTPLTDLAGYRLYVGRASGMYSTIIDVGLTTRTTLTGLDEATTYYLTATAYDTARNESPQSPEVMTKTVVSITTPLEVVMLKPADQTTVLRKSTVMLEATVSAAHPTAQVELFINDAVLCRLTQPPYRGAWTVPGTKGRTYQLRATATDPPTQVSRSPVVTVKAQ